LNKLWNLWSSGNQKLTIELIKSQGLCLYDVLFEFWNNYTEEENDISFKSLLLSNSTQTGMVLDCYQAAFFVFEDESGKKGPGDYWFTTNEKKKELEEGINSWEMLGTITKCNSLEEATQKAILKFIELINELYK
tara:strand:- start:420 stop:824 length:405 start_codon:yes stop_codon:yes gene_type:complete